MTTEEELVKIFSNVIALQREAKGDELYALRKRTTKLKRSLEQAIVHIDATIAHQEARNKSTFITDHAIVRYLERVKNMDRSKLESLVVPTDIWGRIYADGDGEYECATHRVKVVDNTVVTVLPLHDPQPKKKI